MSAELAEFILARVAEVEQMARDAGGGKWESEIDAYGQHLVVGEGITIYDEGGHTVEQATHIAYWDPARVLAKCMADRLIVAEHSSWPGDDPDCVGCGLNMYEEPRTPNVSRCPVLCALASQWDDHPDYRLEWAVT